MTEPNQLGPELLAQALDIELNYWHKPSEAIIIDNERYIFLDKRATKKEQNFKFAHELSHILMHCGQQYGMPELFREYQEWKANSFALHLCVPTFMLEDMKLPHNIYKATEMVCKTFNVTIEVAVKRLKQYENKKQEELSLMELNRKSTEKDHVTNLWYK